MLFPVPLEYPVGAPLAVQVNVAPVGLEDKGIEVVVPEQIAVGATNVTVGAGLIVIANVFDTALHFSR